MPDKQETTTPPIPLEPSKARKPGKPGKARRKKRPAHRPTKLTPERVAKILSAIQAGVRPEAAAGANGIGRTTYFTTMAAGRIGPASSRAGKFYAAVTAAEDAAEQRAQVIVARAMGNTPQLALEWLKHRRREHYSTQQKVTHEGKDGGPLRFTLDDLNDTLAAAGENSDDGEKDRPGGP